MKNLKYKTGLLTLNILLLYNIFHSLMFSVLIYNVESNNKERKTTDGESVPKFLTDTVCQHMRK